MSRVFTNFTETHSYNIFLSLSLTKILATVLFFRRIIIRLQCCVDMCIHIETGPINFSGLEYSAEKNKIATNNTVKSHSNFDNELIRKFAKTMCKFCSSRCHSFCTMLASVQLIIEQSMSKGFSSYILNWQDVKPFNIILINFARKYDRQHWVRDKTSHTSVL